MEDPSPMSKLQHHSPSPKPLLVAPLTSDMLMLHNSVSESSLGSLEGRLSPVGPPSPHNAVMSSKNQSRTTGRLHPLVFQTGSTRPTLTFDPYEPLASLNSMEMFCVGGAGVAAGLIYIGNSGENTLDALLMALVCAFVLAVVLVVTAALRFTTWRLKTITYGTSFSVFLFTFGCVVELSMIVKAASSSSMLTMTLAVASPFIVTLVVTAARGVLSLFARSVPMKFEAWNGGVEDLSDRVSDVDTNSNSILSRLSITELDELEQRRSSGDDRMVLYSQENNEKCDISV